MTEVELLNRLSEAGVVFSVKIPDRGRTVMREASSFDLIEFLSDPDRFYAKCHLVTKETYIAWVADSHCARCTHTIDGVQCKNAVAGGKSLTARNYVAMQGRKCGKHQEFGADYASRQWHGDA
jgi:hypothetical protein